MEEVRRAGRVSQRRVEAVKRITTALSHGESRLDEGGYKYHDILMEGVVVPIPEPHTWGTTYNPIDKKEKYEDISGRVRNRLKGIQQQMFDKIESEFKSANATYSTRGVQWDWRYLKNNPCYIVILLNREQRDLLYAAQGPPPTISAPSRGTTAPSAPPREQAPSAPFLGSSRVAGGLRFSAATPFEEAQREMDEVVENSAADAANVVQCLVCSKISPMHHKFCGFCASDLKESPYKTCNACGYHQNLTEYRFCAMCAIKLV